MKKWAIAGFLLMASFSVLVAEAQQSRRGGFRSEMPQILCDALLLDATKSQLVIAQYDKSREEAREKAARDQEWGSMSREDRMAMFTAMQEETVKGLTTRLQGKFTDKELEAVKAVLARFFVSPVAELRALRLIELSPEQRNQLQPVSMALASSLPSRISLEGVNRETEQKQFDENKQKFLAAVEKNLSNEQKQAWNVKTREVQKEFEEARAQMGNRRGVSN